MKIVLVATNARGKNLVFVTNTLQAYSLQEAIRLATEGALENIYPVYRATGVYLRTKPSVPKKEHLERLSISARQLFSASDNINNILSTQGFGTYWRLYQDSIEKSRPFIVIDEHPMIAKETARVKLQPHRDIIFSAAKKFAVDPYLLGAIIIDEISRMAPFEEIRDALTGQFIGINTSAGIAQVKTDTARDLIKNGYYNPNPNDKELSPAQINKTSRAHLYEYVKEPPHSIFFAAAKIRDLTDEWKRFIDLKTRPEIIATLYHLKHKDPHARPEPDKRGLHIAEEFYLLAKDWLR